MADADRCPNCGSERPGNAPKGLCPRCLLRQGLDSDALSLARGGPAATMPMGSGSGVGRILAELAESTGPIPRVLLRDSDPGTDPGPVVKPGSPEMPEPAGPDARLQLLGEIARGGMGAVLKGRDGDIGRDLAVKVLLEKHRDDPELVRRFVEEAQIAGQLQHPGVVPVYELGAFGDRRPYFTMKLVKGRTLADILAARPAPSADRAQMLGIFLQVCQTVAYAHARGVIHRDLKPSNIMVGGFGEVQVMDWGLAKVLARGGAVADADAGKDPAEQTVIATARSESDSDRSQAGSVMGTPAYMAPEQARGEVEWVDERADVFALGAILCEVLTGRPAFTGRSPAEIQRKAARGDMADAVARLGSCGADAELLALARSCLAAERNDRPREAGAVASGLSTYHAGVQERLRAAELARAAESARAEEAEHTAEAAELARAAESARAEEAQARAAVERSRGRRTMALAASLLAMMGLGGSAFTYVARQRQARAAAVERLLGRATTLLDQARDRPEDPVPWRTARAAVQQVEDDPTGIAADARDRLARIKANAVSGLDNAERDAKLRQTLVDIRANLQDAGLDATDAAYAAAFRDAGLDIDALTVAEAADRLGRRPAAVVVELAAYLDDWSGVRSAAGRPRALSRKPLEVARAADRDDYRGRLRSLVVGDDRKALAARFRALADEPRAAELPAATAWLLGRSLERVGDHDAAVRVLRRAAARHPEDVWVSFALAAALHRLRPSPREEAVRYYTAARALRPETSHALAHLLEEMGRGAEAEAIFHDLTDRRPHVAWNLVCFGKCLKARGRADDARRILDQAVTAGRGALELAPDSARAHLDLGLALAALGKPADAEAECRAAVQLKPLNGIARMNLGGVLLARGKPVDAETEFRAAITLDPTDANAHNGLGAALLVLGKPADAEAECRAALKLNPYDTTAHYNLATALDGQGKPDQAEAVCRAALKLKPDDAVAHLRLGVTLLEQGKPAEAEAEFRAVLRIKPDYDFARLDLGKALLALGKPAEAEAEIRAVLKLQPDSAEARCSLGLLLGQSGRYPEGLKELRRGHELGIRQPGWRQPSAQWVRDAERMAALDARLPAVLKGDDHPADAIERLSFAQICYGRKLHALAARFYAEAIEANPRLADDRRSQHPYNAACAAALAGCGQGKDEPPPDEAARAKLRGQALGWLKAELSAWSRILAGGNPKVRASVREILEHWKVDPDLAGVHNEAGLAKLPAEERPAWLALWADVETLLKKSRGDTP